VEPDVCPAEEEGPDLDLLDVPLVERDVACNRALLPVPVEHVDALCSLVGGMIVWVVARDCRIVGDDLLVSHDQWSPGVGYRLHVHPQMIKSRNGATTDSVIGQHEIIYRPFPGLDSGVGDGTRVQVVSEEQRLAAAFCRFLAELEHQRTLNV